MRRNLETRRKGTWRAKVFVGFDNDTNRRKYLTRRINGIKRHAEVVLRQLLVEVYGGADN